MSVLDQNKQSLVGVAQSETGRNQGSTTPPQNRRDTKSEISANVWKRVEKGTEIVVSMKNKKEIQMTVGFKL